MSDKSHVMKKDDAKYPGFYLCGQDALNAAGWLDVLLADPDDLMAQLQVEALAAKLNLCRVGDQHIPEDVADSGVRRRMKVSEMIVMGDKCLVNGCNGIPAFSGINGLACPEHWEQIIFDYSVSGKRKP